jgi:hypothetical protein
MCVCANTTYMRRDVTPGLRVELAHVTFASTPSAVSHLVCLPVDYVCPNEKQWFAYLLPWKRSRLRVSGVINVGPFLGALASSRITPVSLVMSVGLSVRPSFRVFPNFLSDLCGIRNKGSAHSALKLLRVSLKSEKGMS